MLSTVQERKNIYRSSGITRWARRVRYRISQGLGALWPRVQEDERAILALWLPAKARQLFQQMSPRDRRHSLDVFYILRGAGFEQPDLLAAALLHDVGKSAYNGRRLRTWHRVAAVLLGASSPGWLRRIASDRPDSWRYPFYAHLNHPAWGAQQALQAGCSSLTAALIHRHQTRQRGTPAGQEDRLLAALQAADERS